MPEYPAVAYPTVIKGVIHGDVLRLESLDGSVLWLKGHELIRFSGAAFDGAKITLKDFGPITLVGKPWGVTHLQKKSRRGWLKMSPDCYHWWSFLRMQKKDDKGEWFPGTEFGLYIRKGLGGPFDWHCWRWDVAGTMVDGQLRHWIPSGGYCGGHWD